MIDKQQHYYLPMKLISSAAALSLCSVWEGRRYITPSYDDEQCCGQFLIRHLTTNFLLQLLWMGHWAAITTISTLSAAEPSHQFKLSRRTFFIIMLRGEVIFNKIWVSRNVGIVTL